MLRPSEFRELVSGRRRGPRATLLRTLLRGLETPYSLAVRYRNWRYDSGRAGVGRVDVPVVSVGNLTLGGTGKTPTVEWLARWFLQRGVRVALVSRGYGARDGKPNDEALELAQALPETPHVQDADRIRGARQAIEQFDAQLVLLDDGFQHRRLARDLDIVLVDALEPFGFGHVFPRGTLREPLAGWARADVLVLTRSELLDERQRADVRARVLRYAPRAVWAEATHAPVAFRSPGGEEQPLEYLAGHSVVAFCGIGNPAGFREALARCGCRLTGLREFADHFAYGEQDLDELAAWSERLDVAAVICTMKDLVKIADRWRGRVPLWALQGQLKFLSGLAEAEARLQAVVEQCQEAERKRS